MTLDQKDQKEKEATFKRCGKGFFQQTIGISITNVFFGSENKLILKQFG